MWFSLGLTLTQRMSGIIIKKTSESLAATKEHDFLAKISCVWGYEGGRGERSGISHSNVSFGLNPSEIQWGISVALCFPRAVHCFFGQIKYCNSLVSPRSPIKFKGSNIHSSPLPSWRHFPLRYPSSPLTLHRSNGGWLQTESLAWEERWHFKPLAGGEELEDLEAIVSLCLGASTPCAGAGHGFPRAEGALDGARRRTAPARALGGVPQPQTAPGCRESLRFWFLKAGTPPHPGPGKLLTSPSNTMSGKR